MLDAEQRRTEFLTWREARWRLLLVTVPSLTAFGVGQLWLDSLPRVLEILAWPAALAFLFPATCFTLLAVFMAPSDPTGTALFGLAPGLEKPIRRR